MWSKRDFSCHQGLFFGLFYFLYKQTMTLLSFIKNWKPKSRLSPTLLERAALCCQILTTAHGGDPFSPPLSYLKFSRIPLKLPACLLSSVVATTHGWTTVVCRSSSHRHGDMLQRLCHCMHVSLSPLGNSLCFPYPPNLQVFFLCWVTFLSSFIGRLNKMPFHFP